MSPPGATAPCICDAVLTMEPITGGAIGVTRIVIGMSGQVFMAAADVAMWLAIMTKLGTSEAAVTAEMKTNFLNGAREEDFLCQAKILKLGKTHHTITYIRAWLIGALHHRPSKIDKGPAAWSDLF